MDRTLSVSDVLSLADMARFVVDGAKVRYITSATSDERVAHLRGFTHAGDVTTAMVRLSDWHTEWEMSLIELATLKATGRLGLDRD